MLLRGLVPLTVALGVVLAPEPARACSCGRRDTPDIERCQTAKRVFAGTVEAVESPPPFELQGTTTVQLRVDTVWRGDPPAALLAYTGHPCGGFGVPAPGSAFMICDDSDDPWTAFGMCGGPRFGAAPEIRATLGPGRPASQPPALALQRWRSEELLWALAAILVFPLIGVGLGASIGRLRGRVAAAARPPIRGLLVLAVGIVAVRLVLRATLPSDDNWYERQDLQIVLTVGLATIVGLWLAYRGQRRGGPAGFGLLGVGLVLFAGFMRLHLPVQPGGAVACSEARAREFLRTVPIDLDLREDEWKDHERWQPSPATAAVRAEGLRLAAEAVPNECTDLGLRRMRFDAKHYEGPCVEFADGEGGARRLCARREYVEYYAEQPG